MFVKYTYHDKPRQHIKEQRHHFSDKGPYSQTYVWRESKLAQVACSGSLIPHFVNEDYVTPEIIYSPVYVHYEILTWS